MQIHLEILNGTDVLKQKLRQPHNKTRITLAHKKEKRFLQNKTISPPDGAMNTVLTRVNGRQN